MKIKTTVIGSHPVTGEGDDAIRAAVGDMVGAGIDIISDGQTRKDMVGYLADHIPGFKVEEGRSQIIGKIKPPEETPLPADLNYAKKIAGSKAEVKAIMTGPVTMVFFAELSPSAPYKGFRDETLYRDIAEALAVEAEMIQKEGFRNFQLDEPSYSIGAPMLLAKLALERVTDSIKGTRALHVCGNLRGSFQDIVKIDGIDVLSFAFKDNFSNFDTVDSKMLEDYGKKLGIGCVSSTESAVESEDEIRSLLRKALGAYSVDNIAWIHPDCGLRSLERDAAIGKLRNMVSALKGMKEELE
jgi:5-methyltetrahydropteroyltriglutamate--homocysteine methyltransferase